MKKEENLTETISNGRRSFLKTSSLATVSLGLLGTRGLVGCSSSCALEPFKISLAQWSLHRALRAGSIDALDFAEIASSEFGIKAVEYVNQFYKGKAQDTEYLTRLKAKATDNGVTSVLIMVDGEGHLGDADEAKRKQVVENHYKWIDAAKFLGCHSIRVNAGGQGSREVLAPAVVDGLGRLAEFAAKSDINVIVENHGGYSSDGAWLAAVMAQVNMDNCGTLPDFGNFCIRKEKAPDGTRVCVDEYDRYKGVAELMPYAKAVSAKTHDFNESGDEIHTDYYRMMKIVLDAGYNGYVGIEYEGSKVDEYTGIRKTRDLLLKVRAQQTG